MEIETYEPYHIGIKLTSPLTLSAFRKRIVDAMAKNSDFTDITTSDFDPNYQNELIAKFEDVRIEFNYVSLALNTVGDSPNKTSVAFRKLLDLLVDLDYELDNTLVVFYEIISNIIIKINQDSSNMLTKSVNCDLEGFRELNPNVNVSTLKIDLIDKEFGRESMALTIGSNPVRSKSSMLVGLRYKHTSNEKIFQFNEKIGERIIKLLNSLKDGEK